MNLEFVLDNNYLAYLVLTNDLYNESKELNSIKNKLFTNNKKAYLKITNKEIYDLKVYTANNKEVKKLLNELINSSEFNKYKKNIKESKENIAIKILNGTIKEDKELIKLKDYLWDKYRSAYKSILNINYTDIANILLDKDVFLIVESFKKTQVFQKLLKETKDYLSSIKKYWENNKELIDNYLKKILKIDLNNSIKAYIVHPSICNGYNMGNNKIVWGHIRGITDYIYNLTYLIHESLHTILPFLDNEDHNKSYIKHATIELVSDYELYSLLSNKCTFNEGHEYLNNYRINLYPYWLKYIGLSDKEIKDRHKKDNIKYNKIIINDDLSKYNIHEFIEYCYSILKEK